MRDQDIQNEGEQLKEEIRALIRTLVFNKLFAIYGNDFEKNVAKLKHDCEGKIYEIYGDNDDFNIEDHNWKDWIEIPEYKTIIDKNFSNDIFAETFGIPLTDKATSKKDKLNWISLVEQHKGKKKIALTKSDVNRLWLIRDHLNKFISSEE